MIQTAFPSVMNDACEGLALVSQHDCHFLSESAQECLGYTLDDLTGVELWELIHSEERDQIQSRARWLRQSPGQSVQGRFRFRHANGSWLWLEALATNLNEHPAQAIVVHFRDVTELVRAEAQRHQLTSNLTERVKELDILHETAWLLQRNLPTQELLEVLVDLLPRGWHYPDRAAVRITYGTYDVRSTTYTESDWVQDAGFQTRAGTSGQIEVAYLGSPPDDASVFLPEEQDLIQSLAELLCLHFENLEGEQALRRSEQRFRDLLEAAPDLIATLDNAGRFVSLNSAFESMLGRRRADWLGQHFHGLLVEEERAHADRLFERILAKETPPMSEFHLQRGDGSIVATEVTVAPLSSDGNSAVALAIVRDISQRKQLETQFLQAQKLEDFGQIAGGVAHDYNNLLTIVTGYSEIALARLEAASPLRPLIQEIRKAGESSAALTRQLLAFSQRQALKLEILDVNVIIADLEKMLRRLLGADIKLTTRLAPDLPCIRADAGQIEQVILNLVVNSREAMPDGGELVIESRLTYIDDLGEELPRRLKPGPYVRLSIKDSGHGMDPAIRARIFEPFFSTKAPGTRGSIGLGLAAVFGIVTQCGGHIDVASAPGKGTTFFIDLPAVEVPGAQSSTQLLPTGTETVLIVEDDDNLRGLMREVLAGQGFQILEAANGQEALDVSSRHDGPIHLLVSDIVMPAMNGRQLAERLEQQRPRLKTLFLSGYSDSAVLRKGTGAEHSRPFLAKPFQPRGLVRKVREVLEASAG